MGTEARELLAFMKALAGNPSDIATRHIFADWLEEHDEPEEAKIHREWDQNRHDAEEWVKTFCQKYGADYDDLLVKVKAGDGYCFGDDDGPEVARYDEDFWEHISVLTGSELDRDQSFRCAC